jgi:hypothetical protein
MSDKIEQGFMAFLADGATGIGAVREVTMQGLVIYVENAGEFNVPLSAVMAVHDQKVMLDKGKLGKALLKAASRSHDQEDPNLAG